MGMLFAYLCKNEKEQIPAPKGFYEGKVQEIEDGKTKIENVVLEGKFPEGFKRASLGRFCYLEGDCIYGYTIDTRTDMKIRIYGGDDGKKTVFNKVARNFFNDKLEEIATGRVFGVIDMAFNEALHRRAKLFFPDLGE